MKKLLLALAALLCIHVSSAQKYSPVHLSFFPPMSTNGREAPYYTNNFSFSILSGVSLNERGVAFAGLTNDIRDSAQGLQFAGIGNKIDGSGQGVAIGGLANLTGSYQGFMMGGLVNLSGATAGGQVAGLVNLSGAINGYQFAGLVNASGHTRGFQVGGIANITGKVDGFQFGGIANIASKVDGFQFGGITNIASGVDGFQFAGVANVASYVHGLQFAGIANVSASTDGMQFAGIANAAAHVSGIQFAGIFNRAKYVDGVQFAGILNIAEQSDYPIGLVNIIRDGELGIGVSYNEAGSATVSFRSGGRVMYGIVGLGYNHKDKGDGVVLEGGFGAHINCNGWLRIKNELVSQYIGDFKDSSTTHNSLAVMPSFRLAKWFEVFGGPSINYMQSDNIANTGMFPSNSLWKEYTAKELKQVYVGFKAGVQFRLN